ncbi:zinc finger CW-type PWWP domain protein 1-like isoform X2 [Branchiostoma floridae]|uniref:Zinc finger CW-type PWWP domain protein 1-like isoform X2 n=1 Tax=Branchiostoma floridae TaxID=7739 RepID=A0A9J7M9W0_BRAFL|nr:zinc finger CW-type PWWP domain protein 1-like isoform X2 [Branchiostoma floridae]
MDLIKQKNCFKTPVTGPMLDLSSSKGRVDDEQEVPSSPQGNEPSSPDLADLGLPASPTGTSTVTEDMLEEKSQKLDDKEEKDAAKDSRVSNQKTGKVASSLNQEEWEDLFTAVLSKPPDPAKEANPVDITSIDDFECLAVDAKKVVEGEGSDNWKKEHGETEEQGYDGKDYPDKTPATSEHTTPKCHTPQKPTKPRSKKRKLHPKQLVYSDKAPEGTENPETSMTTKKKKQPKSSSKKSIYEFTDETRPSSPAISSTRKPKKQGKKRMSKRKHFLSREIEEQGTWVQCTADKCNKWRYLADVTDPTTVPDKWTCSMNPDEEYNSCEKTEADWSKLEFVDTCYVEGSLVWAKMPGYPWWPGMVEEDPDDQAYYETDSKQKPVRYHVVFFGKTVSRAWIPERSVRPFTQENDVDHLGSLVVDGKNYRKRVKCALTMARQAVVLSIKKRLQTFGFGQRFQGHWGRQEVSSDEDEKEPAKKTARKSSPQVEAQLPSPDDLSDSGSVEDLMEQAEKVLGNAESFLSSVQKKDEKENDDQSDEEFEYSPGKVMKISDAPPVLKKEKKQPKEPKLGNKRKEKKSNENEVPKKKKKTSLSEEDGKKTKISLEDKEGCQDVAGPKKAPAFKPKMKKSKPTVSQKENNVSNNDKDVTGNNENEIKPKTKGKHAASAPKAKKPSFKPPRPKTTTPAIPLSKDKTDSKAAKPKCEPPIPFDSEVFTMEMDSQEKSCNKHQDTGDQHPFQTTKKATDEAYTPQRSHSDDMPHSVPEVSNVDGADDFHSAPTSPSIDQPDQAAPENVCPSSPGMDMPEEDVDPAVFDSCVPSSPAMDFDEHLEDRSAPVSPLMDLQERDSDCHDASCLPVHGAEDTFSDNSQPFDLEE